MPFILVGWELYCDVCNAMYGDHRDKAVLSGMARRAGWSIGKRILCPRCRRKQKGEVAR